MEVDGLREEDAAKVLEKRQREAARTERSGQGGARGSGMTSQWGGAVVGSGEAAEKVCSQSRRFMAYHSISTVI